MVGEQQHNWYIIGVIEIEQVGEVKSDSRVNPIQVPTQGGGYFQSSLCIFSRHFVYILWNSMFQIDSVPQAVQAACHHGYTQTNKPTKRDDRVDPLISPLHNADKASAAPFIG